MTTMRAYVLNRYGKADAATLAEVPIPEPGPGEVRIAVKAAGLNPLDFKIREGVIKPITKFKLPIVLGNEVAGIVEALGEGVKDFAIGDAVYARVAKDRLGAFAEKVCVYESFAAKKPAGLDFEHAAAVPLAALTALQVLRDQLQIRPGQRVFIPGGAGGVGIFAVQIAKQLGAIVTTTASPRGAALVRELGADHVIDYTTQDFSNEIRDQDAVFDLIGKDTLARAFRVVKPGRVVLSIAGPPEPTTARVDLQRGSGLAFLFWLVSLATRSQAWRNQAKYRFYFMHPSGDDLRALGRMIDEGKLRVIVDRAFKFSEIADAMAYLETGRAKGKVVVSL